MTGKVWVASKRAGIAAVLMAFVALPASAAGAVDQALLLIRGVCGLPGAQLQIQPAANGKVELRITLAGGERRATSLAAGDLDAFVAAARAMVAEEPAEVASCMDPYLDQVTARLAAGTPTRPATGGGSYVPPTLPASPPPGATPPSPSPASPPSPPSPPSPSPPSPPAMDPVAPSPPGLGTPPPLYPASGDLPVGVVNNPGSQPTPGAAREPLTLQLGGCRTASRNVVCDIQVNNGTGQDLRLVVQGAHTRLHAADGSQWPAAQAALGNQRGDLRAQGGQAQLQLIAGTAPLVSLTFNNVPGHLTAIKRLEVSIGAQTAGGTQLQKITLNDVPIQGR